MIDVLKTIISEYANSPTIIQLVKNMDQYLDPRADFDAFYDFVFNVDTAVGFGLDVWGRIVNIGRTLQIPATPLYFGFSEASPGSYAFNDEPFWDGIPAETQTYILADDAYRKLILCKAMANISAVSAPALNQLLQNLFAGRGRCYVNDMGNMEMRYTFEFTLTSYEFAIVTQSGVLPIPCGVKATVFQSPIPLFGFSEAGPYSAAPFGQGVFIPIGATSELN